MNLDGQLRRAWVRFKGGAWHGAWHFVCDLGGEMQWYSTWIGEVGLEHWGRAGLVGGDGDGDA